MVAESKAFNFSPSLSHVRSGSSCTSPTTIHCNVNASPAPSCTVFVFSVSFLPVQVASCFNERNINHTCVKSELVYRKLEQRIQIHCEYIYSRCRKVQGTTLQVYSFDCSSNLIARQLPGPRRRRRLSAREETVVDSNKRTGSFWPTERL